MKKLLTIAALMGVASLSYGQGSVNFANSAAAATHISVTDTTGANPTQITGAGGYYFALFVAPVGTAYTPGSSFDPTAAGFTFTGGTGTNTAATGRFNGNPTTDGAIISGYAAGSSANFVVVGWSANLGLDWASFHSWDNNRTVSGWAGQSLVATSVQLGGGLIPQGNIFGANPGQVAGFTLGYIPVPEPTTFALAGLGAAALMIFRRRK